MVEISEQKLYSMILETAVDFLSNDSVILCEGLGNIDEGALSAIRDRVKAAADYWENNQDGIEKKIKGGLKNGYGSVLNTVKDVLSKNGITATRKHPLTGLPSIQSTSRYNDEINRDRTLSEIRKRIIARIPQYADKFSDEEYGGKLFNPAKHGDQYGYSCKVVGDSLVTQIESLDSDQLSVVSTGMHKWGFDDSPFIEKAFFIFLPVEKTA